MSKIKRLCIDTNVYIIGIQEVNSDEAKIIESIGYYGKQYTQIEAEIILSPELIDQIRRVGKYLWNKDKAGLVLGLIWSNLNIFYVTPNAEWWNLLKEINLTGNIPTEDIEVFLTAKFGLTDCFVSSNRELIKAIADSECLTPDISTNISNKYL